MSCHGGTCVGLVWCLGVVYGIRQRAQKRFLCFSLQSHFTCESSPNRPDMQALPQNTAARQQQNHTRASREWHVITANHNTLIKRYRGRGCPCRLQRRQFVHAHARITAAILVLHADHIHSLELLVVCIACEVILLRILRLLLDRKPKTKTPWTVPVIHSFS